MPRVIVAFSGPRACGKSTIAGHLVNTHGYTRIAFADILRDIANSAGDDFINDRDYLSRLGSTIRDLWPGFLLEVVSRRIATIDGPIVIEDIRFPAEFEFCKSIGAFTVQFEISREEQINRLASRDGKTGFEAEQLLDITDENLLIGMKDWNYTCVAVGDYKRLALELVEEIERGYSCRESGYILNNRIYDSPEVKS
jgi:cytidylate kinase